MTKKDTRTRRRRLKDGYHTLKQQHQSSCGQTCLAMLTGLSYNDVIQLYDEKVRSIKKRLRSFSKQYYSSIKELKTLLHVIDPTLSLTYKRFTSWQNLLQQPCRAILVTSPEKYSRHALIFVNSKTQDGELNAKIIDPSDGLVTLFDNCRPSKEINIVRYWLLKKS